MPAMYALRALASAAASGSAKNGPKQQNTEEKPLVAASAARIANSVSGCASMLLLNPPAPAEMVRPKQVTDPLNEMARARLCGDQSRACNYGSSGSEHGPNSACLADMVYGFMEEDGHGEVGNCGRSRCNCLNGTRKPCPNNIPEEDEDGHEEGTEELRRDLSSDAFVNGDLGDILEGLVACIGNPVEAILLREATKVLQQQEGYRSPVSGEGIKLLRRSLMRHLRGMGYNAGLCKSRWEPGGGFPSGDYEYIDVVIEGNERFLLDIDFRMQFEIARPTAQYDGLVRILPNVFAGKAERLKQIVKIMCDSAKSSLKKKGMHLPPWRKHRYMQAKWFGPYKRTTNPMPGSNPDPQSAARNFGGIALKGAGWDSAFMHQMELHYERTKRDKRMPNPKPEEIAVVVTDWKLPGIDPKPVPTARASGLASALNGAGLTCMFRLENAPQKA